MFISLVITGWTWSKTLDVEFGLVDEKSSWKKFTNTVAILVGWSFQVLVSSLIPNILFFLCHCVARLWKYFVLLSPWLTHLTWDLWLHIRASLSRSMLMSDLISLSRELSPPLWASISAWCSICLFFSSSLRTLPKQFLFHHSRSLPHYFTLFKTSLFECGLKDCLYAASTVSPH